MNNEVRFLIWGVFVVRLTDLIQNHNRPPTVIDALLYLASIAVAIFVALLSTKVIWRRLVARRGFYWAMAFCLILAFGPVLFAASFFPRDEHLSPFRSKLLGDAWVTGVLFGWLSQCFGGVLAKTRTPSDGR
jgi:uncharacterized membrane protein YedE/YeeE